MELLAVILILGILVAAALPNFLSAEDNARDAVDRANVRSINAAIELYRYRTGACPTASTLTSMLQGATVAGVRYFPDASSANPIRDPVDGFPTSVSRPGQPGWDDYPTDYDTTNCRVVRD